MVAPAYQRDNASAPFSPRFEMLSKMRFSAFSRHDFMKR
jgi:hypothetical protein